MTVYYLSLNYSGYTRMGSWAIPVVKTHQNALCICRVATRVNLKGVIPGKPMKILTAFQLISVLLGFSTYHTKG